jgi:hypothetical protein
MPRVTDVRNGTERWDLRWRNESTGLVNEPADEDGYDEPADGINDASAVVGFVVGSGTWIR